MSDAATATAPLLAIDGRARHHPPQPSETFEPAAAR